MNLQTSLKFCMCRMCMYSYNTAVACFDICRFAFCPHMLIGMLGYTIYCLSANLFVVDISGVG